MLSVLTIILLGLTCDVFSQNATARFCGSPPLLTNAIVSNNGETEGSVATYTCLAGFTASGSMQSLCRNGFWVVTGVDPECKEQFCPSLPYVPSSNNNARYGVQHAVGTIVRYNCYSGHHINNTDQVECLSNLTWSLPKPICAPVDCGPPPSSPNAVMNATKTTYPSSVMYTCQTGYRLVNPNQYGPRSPPSLTVSCMFSGVWGNPPSCQPVRCRSPPLVRYGYKLYGNSYFYQDVVVYGCDVGYTIQGNETVTCMDTGFWSPRPTCAIVKCSDPPVVANSTITSTPTVNYGNSSYYHCDEGFYMSGFSHVTCKADGSWTDPPTCNIINCRSPPAILFGKHEFTSTTFGSKVMYSCDKGYKLIGVSEVICLADGSWDSTPSCQSAAAAGASVTSALTGGRSVADNSATIASLAVAVAVMGLITLFFLVFFAFKIYPHKSKLFSYASYKNGDDAINSSI